MGHSGAKGHSYDASSDFEAVFRTAERGGAEGVTVWGPGDTGGPGVLNCQV